MKKIFFTIFVLCFAEVSFSQHIGTGLGDHSIVSKLGGQVYTWGKNWNGQLGDGTNTTSNHPVAVVMNGALIGKTITQIAAGEEYSIALASDGTVYTWGSNYYGQLGTGNGTSSNVPVAVTGGLTFKQVAAGLRHSIALASDGTVYTWGYNYYGQLGNGNTGTNSYVPVAVVISGKTITKVAAGAYHSIALASDGKVYTWGINSQGQLGNNTLTNSNVPVAVYTGGVLSGKTITKVAAGAHHSIVLDSDGKVYTWGLNQYGQLGNNTTNTYSKVPEEVYTTGGVLSGKTITQVAAGLEHSIALASDGTVYTWGNNTYGQLGDGSNVLKKIPVSVVMNGALNGKTIIQVAAGYEHSIALASDGTLYTWGKNNYGQLGNQNSGTNSNVPVAVYQNDMGILPVELTTFTAASSKSRSVLLNWQTATEISNYGFDVERSKDKSNWGKIGFVEGNGNSNSPKNYSFTDKTVSNGTVQYRLKQIDTDGKYSYSNVVEINIENLPNEFVLNQNYPNPFNPSTSISYSIPSLKSELSGQAAFVTLKIYNILGSEVAALVNEPQAAGRYEVKFDASKLASGIYLYKLQAGEFVQTKKLTLLK